VDLRPRRRGNRPPRACLPRTSRIAASLQTLTAFPLSCAGRMKPTGATLSTTALTTSHPKSTEVPRAGSRAKIQDPQETSWSLSTTTPARSCAGPLSCWRTKRRRRSGIPGRHHVALRYPSTLKPAPSGSTMSLSSGCHVQPQCLDNSMKSCSVIISYASDHGTIQNK
jgi:hypothetical protein